MAPHERILLVEDNRPLAVATKFFLERAGHTVVDHATSLGEALGSVGRVQELRFKVAVVDGSLGSGKLGCKDGEAVEAEIRRKAPGVTVVAFSSKRLEDIDFGDIAVEKTGSHRSFQELADRITALPR